MPFLSSRTVSPFASSTRHPPLIKKLEARESRYVCARISLFALNVCQPRTLEVFHFLGVLPELRARGAPLKPVVFYKLPGGTEVLETTSLSLAEEDTPTKPFVRHMPSLLHTSTYL